MIRLTFILMFFVCQLIIGQQLNTITKKYNSYVTELNQGIGVLVQKDGIIETSTIGKGNFNEHTVFNIGSATKKMTAILILQEVEKGNLKLSDSIGKFLNPIKNVDMSLSIETLLRHQSGLGEYVNAGITNDYFAQRDSIYNRDFLLHIPKSSPKRVGKYSYCNTNYLLLGKIIEKVTDRSYFDLLRERIFIPADMKESYPYVSKNLKNLANPTHNGNDVSKFLDYRFFANYAYAAGSIASTLNDMATFYQHLFEKKTLLSEKSLEKLIAFDDANYALGMMKFRDGYIGHGGNNVGYSFRELYNPKTKNIILFFANSRSIPFNKMLKTELLAYVNGKKLPEVTFNENTVNDFKSVVGKYQFEYKDMKMNMEVVAKNNQLYFAAQGTEVLLVSKEKNKLYNGDFGVELEVIPNNNKELTFRQNGLETTIKRIQ